MCHTMYKYDPEFFFGSQTLCERANLCLASLECLRSVVQDRGGRPGGSDKHDSLVVGSNLTRALSRGCIRRVENERVGDRTEHRKIFEGHLRGTVLADGDARMRAGAFHVRLGDGSHSELIEGPSEECGEGRDERNRTLASSATDGHT